MSDKLGPLSFGKRDELVFLGREIGEQRNYSDEIAKQDRRGSPGDHRQGVRASDGGPHDPPRSARGAGREARRRGDRRRRRVRDAVHGSSRPSPRTAASRRSSAPASRSRSRTRSRPDPAPHPCTAHERAGPPARSFDSADRLRRCLKRSPLNPDLETHLDATRDERIESLKAFLRIPSISTLPEHAPDVRARGRVAGRRRSGMPASSTSRSPRPAAIRSYTAIGCTPRERRPWSSTATTTSSRSTRSISGSAPPFEPSCTTVRIVGRGTADDKGQIHAHAMAATWLLGGPRTPSRSTSATCSRARRRTRGEHLDAWLDGQQGSTGSGRR